MISSSKIVRCVPSILLLIVFDASHPVVAQQTLTSRDIREVPVDLHVPQMADGQPAPGVRVKQRLPGYPEAVYHTLYLPTDWNLENEHPVIVEFAGNGLYKNEFGDISTGFVEGSKLGYGIAAGKKAIWVCAPFLNNSGTENVRKWWGDAPNFNVEPTVNYLKQLVPFVCKKYGGDSKRVLLTGFSRGAIACNYIGLHDDEIAEYWKAMIPFSHYDGVRQWSFSESGRDSAVARLRRLGDCPQLICSETVGGTASIAATRVFVESTGIEVNATFLSTGFRNHNDEWILRPSAAREHLRKWVTEHAF